MCTGIILTLKALQHETDSKQKERGKESVSERLRNTGIYYYAAQENEIYELFKSLHIFSDGVKLWKLLSTGLGDLLPLDGLSFQDVWKPLRVENGYEY